MTNGRICHFLFLKNAVKIITVAEERTERNFRSGEQNKIGHMRLSSHMVRDYLQEEIHMANRIVLNETSYHGAGAIKEIANEVKTR